MGKEQENKSMDRSTETLIKEAAREVFHHKGYAATRTRDIAEKAGMNIALLNYYFRSKEKLFNIIMLETLQAFSKDILVVINDPKTSLQEKVHQFCSSYIDMLTLEPQLPLFVVSELRNHPDELLENMNIKKFIFDSVFIEQYQDAVNKGEVAPVPVIHFIMNLVGMTVFPFIGSPILKSIGGLQQDQFTALMNERKKLIPVWINQIIKPK